VTEQHIQIVGPDGKQRTRGPYPLYTFTEEGKTFSRRLHDQAEVAVYRKQIQHWRRFSDLVERLRVLGEQPVLCRARHKHDSYHASRTQSIVEQQCQRRGMNE
jgi:hypothetical protein